MRKALGYARLSKSDVRSHSISYQTQEIRKLAEREGFRLVGIEVDEQSGKSLENRSGVQRIIQAIHGRLVDAVLVFRSDRLSRDGLDSLMLEKAMQEAGIAYLSATEGPLIDADPLLRHVRIGVNESERWKISLRTKRALQDKKERGQPLGRAPFGWRYQNKRLVPEPGEQRAIARMRELQAGGCSTRKIVDALRREGICTRAGTVFSQTQIVRILQRAA